MKTMTALPKPRPSEELLPTNDLPSPVEAAPQPALKVVTDEPLPAAQTPQPAAPHDPLRAIKALSEEEKIALCT